MKKRKLNAAVAVYIIVGIILCALVGNALAKYFQTSSNPSTFKAMDFYFSSELLDEGVHTLSPGVTEMEFTLRNYADTLRISEVDVKITDVTISGTAGAAVAYDADITLKSNYLEQLAVKITGLVPGGEYNITATATGGSENGVGGYVKTITGTIKVPAEENKLYKYFQNYGSYVLLTVWAQGYQGDVKIDIPEGVIPDNTDAVMADAVTGGIVTDTTTFNQNKYSSHVYRFFVTGGSVTADSFVVKYAGETKTAGYRAP
ncbi:MAG: hypothetical protein IKV39_05285 [Clostridia bacterium]|nr:hypothetical protein [Clostridia bacterium]